MDEGQTDRPRLAPPSPELWIGWHAAGMRGMQETARWVLGVVAAGLLTAVQLGGIGRFGPADRPFWLAVVAAVVVVASMAEMIRSVLALQPGAGPTKDVRRLSDGDFAYVQDWGFMRGYPTSHDRYAAVNQKVQMLQFFSDEAMGAERRPKQTQAASRAGELREQLAWARWEEHQAAALLGHRDVSGLFTAAKRRMLVCGVIALVGIFVLTWAANPPQSGVAVTGTVAGSAP